MKSIDTMMERAVAQDVFPGAALLASLNNEIIYHNSFGVMDMVSKKPVQKNSIFDLASLTKPLSTVLAVFKLIEQKKISLEHKISSTLTDIKTQDKRDITIKQLLNHTSGLLAYKEYFPALMNFQKDLRRSRLRELVMQEPLVNEPGKAQEYSDLGYILLAWIVEHVSGKRIDRFVREYIYDPLGVDGCFFIDLFDSDNMPEGLKERIVSTEDCPWREKILKGEVHDDNAWAAGGIEGHAGLFGDVFSVWKILLEILNGLTGKDTIVFKKYFVSGIMEKERGSRFRAGFDTPSEYGSSSGGYFSGSSVGHLGFTGTSFWIDPEKELIVILLSNRVHPSRKNEKIKFFRPEIHNLIMENLL